MRSAKLKHRLLVLTGLLAAVGAGAAILRTDLLLNRGLLQALELSRAGLTFEGAAGRRAGAAAPAGDEGFWLTRAEVESTAPFAKPLAVGDRITIAGPQGGERRLEVVDVKAVGSTPPRGPAVHGQLLLVSCRVMGESAERGSATVRFIIEAEAPLEGVPAPAKAL